MNDRQRPPRQEIGDGALERGLAAAFASRPTRARSVLDAMGPRASRVVLRDDTQDAGSPVVRPTASPSAGRYQLHGEIARGGVGVVLKGRDVDLGRDVALKVLRDEHVDNADVVRRFVEEAQVGGQLQHPGIVPVYEMGLQVDGRTPWFAMKLVKGRTFSALLAERRSPADDRRRMLGIFEQICQTMAYAHSRGVVHRDLKPGNVMLGAFGEVQVVDWGFAKVLRHGGPSDDVRVQAPQFSVIETLRSASPDAQSMAGSVMGTPQYMPPEQARGRVDELDERSDVFSLGAVLCEILTGQPAYAGDMATLLVRVGRADLADAHARLDACGADAEIVGICKGCLVADRSARPRDAGVLAQAVGAHLGSVETRAQEARVAATAARRTQRLAIGVGVVVAVAFVVSLLFSLDADTQRTFAEKRTQEAIAAKSEVEKRNRRLERVEYASRMNAAADAIDAGELEGVAWRLDESDPRQRGVEFDWLRFRATLPTPEVLEVATGPVVDVHFSPDGTRIATASIAGDVDVVLAAHGERVCRISPGGQRVAWLPDGRRLVTLHEDGAIGLFDAASGRPVCEADHGARGLALAVSRDGRLVATAGADGTVRIANASDLAEIRRLQVGDVCCHTVEFDADARRVLVATGRADNAESGALVLDAETGRRVAAPFRCVVDGQSLSCTSASFDPECRLVLASYTGGRSMLWSMEHGCLVHELEGHRWWVNGIVYSRGAGFSPDGRWALTCGSDGHVRVHEVATGRRVGYVSPHLTSPTLHTGVTRGALVSPDGLSILTWGHGGRIQRWRWLDLALPADFPASPGRHNVGSVDVDAAGRTAYAVDDTGVVTGWDLGTGLQVLESAPLPGGVSEHAICVLPDGRLAVVGGDLTLRLLDARTGRVAAELPAPADVAKACTERRQYAMDLRCSRDGRHVAAAVGTGYSSRDVQFRTPVIVYDVAGAAPPRVFSGHAGGCTSIAFSADGRRLFSAGMDQHLRAWDLGAAEGTGAAWDRFEGTAEQMPSTVVAVTPRGAVAVGFPDGRVQSFDPATGAPEGQDRTFAIQGMIAGLAFPGDGDRMVVLGWGSRLAMWNEDRQQMLSAHVSMPPTALHWPWARLAQDASRILVTMPRGWIRVISLRGSPGAGDTAATRADSDAVRLATVRLIDNGMNVDAAVANVRSDPSVPAPLAAQAAEIARRMEIGWFRYAQASIALTVDRTCTKLQAKRAEALGNSAVEASEPGSGGRALALSTLGLAQIRLENTAEAEALFAEADATLQTSPDHPWLAYQMPALRALIAVARGRPTEARAMLDEARRRFALYENAPHDQTLDLAIKAVEGDSQ